MIRLVYSSRAKEPMSQEAVLELLRVSRANNAAREITGVLLYHQERFFQVLEGPEEAVRVRFARIKQDSRHSDVVVLLTETTDQRLFEAWSMGFVPTSALPPDAQASFVSVLTSSQAANQLLPAPSVIRVLLKTFAVAAGLERP